MVDSVTSGHEPTAGSWTLASAAIAGGVVVVLLVVANRYGWHRDEFYYVKSGQNLAWGYVDNPPLMPFIARVATEIAPGNLVVFRLFPACWWPVRQC